jgi:hypothetical protein
LVMSKTRVSNFHEVRILTVVESLSACRCLDVVKLPTLRLSPNNGCMPLLQPHDSSFFDPRGSLSEQGVLGVCDESCSERADGKEFVTLKKG